MSRHEIAGREPGSRVVLGWDVPMMTYFVHVFTTGAGDDEGPLVWLGTVPLEIYELEDLKRAVAPYAELSVELAGELYRDRDEGR